MRCTAVLFVTLAICWTAYATNQAALNLKKTQPVPPKLNANIGTICPIANGNISCSKTDAVCCSDGRHCCPKGYKCDLNNQACVLSSNSTNSSSPKRLMLESMQAVKAKPQLVPCSVGYCDDGETCCLDGCCPYSDGVCCYGDKCCPGGTSCTFDGNCV